MKTALFVMASVLVMCGGHANDALDPQARFDQLSAGQLKQLCDWLASAYGGYGRSVGCDGSAGGGEGPVDQASCVSVYLQGQPTYSDCTMTVDQFEKCMTFRLQFMCVDPPATTSDPCVVAQSPACSG
jgi:hypothetical protein